ncbi:MAG: hypothetical protein U5J96_17270 [Ignavibacteriaceae bacterium]|nr:hypothetical protein [Ignavibacteriaceae bacterium]
MMKIIQTNKAYYPKVRMITATTITNLSEGLVKDFEVYIKGSYL